MDVATFRAIRSWACRSNKTAGLNRRPSPWRQRDPGRRPGRRLVPLIGHRSERSRCATSGPIELSADLRFIGVADERVRAPVLARPFPPGLASVLVALVPAQDTGTFRCGRSDHGGGSLERRRWRPLRLPAFVTRRRWISDLSFAGLFFRQVVAWGATRGSSGQQPTD